MIDNYDNSETREFADFGVPMCLGLGTAGTPGALGVPGAPAAV